jgi:hypothetical protein
MMEKMGHVNGTGLGSNGTGILVPLAATMQNGRAGVGMFSARNEPPLPSSGSVGKPPLSPTNTSLETILTIHSKVLLATGI